MSGVTGGPNTTEGGVGFSYLGSGPANSELAKLLLRDDIVPGTAPSYQDCKVIYEYHQYGAKMVDRPIEIAQSQAREITISRGPEEPLVEAFQREWKQIGTIGADDIIANTWRASRIYGVSSLGMGERDKPTSDPVEPDKIADADLYFNVFDPLNTAGSITLNQDPNAPDFQKPHSIRVAGVEWNPSRTITVMNGPPIYIGWSNPTFSFGGRSVYQRALYPLKTLLLCMVADQWVVQKVGLLVAKMEQASSAPNRRIMDTFGFKRRQLKAGHTGNVLSIGANESIESINLQNLDQPYRISRENALKDIAAANSMPAHMLDQETMVSGFGEGSEDAKQIARYIDRVRIDMAPLYQFFDRIVQRRAWSPDFYVGIQKRFREYRDVPYETAFYQWVNSFNATWPNLLIEPDSERAKTDDIRFKSVTALVEVLAPLIGDPENRASLASWAAEEVNSRQDLFTAPLELNEDAMREHAPPAPPASRETSGREPAPTPFDYES